MKGFIEIKVYERPVTLAVSAIVSVYADPSEASTSVLTLNTSAYTGPGNTSNVLFLDLDYQELLARIEQAQQG